MERALKGARFSFSSVSDCWPSASRATSDHFYGLVETSGRRLAQRCQIELERGEPANRYEPTVGTLDFVGHRQHLADREVECRREVGCEFDNDSCLAREASSETTSLLLDSGQNVSGQQVIQLLWMEIDGMRQGGDIVERQFSS